jgi:hypothetical protein
MDRGKLDGVAPDHRDNADLGFAQLLGPFADNFEHRLGVRGRAADDTEYVCGRRLLLQRFAQRV